MDSKKNSSRFQIHAFSREFPTLFVWPDNKLATRTSPLVRDDRVERMRVARVTKEAPRGWTIPGWIEEEQRRADVQVAAQVAAVEVDRFTFVHQGSVDDDAIRAALRQRGYAETTDARWFSSQNHPCSLDSFVEVLTRSGSGVIRYQKCDPDSVPALTEWDA